MRRASTILAAVVVVSGSFAALHGCKDKNTPAPPAAPSIQADSDAHPTVVHSATPAAKDAACVVQYTTWQGGPNAGDDLSDVALPYRVPANVSLTISIRRTGHELRVQGPAAIRPCTREEPDVVLVASGDVSVDSTVPVRPGSEIFLATPSFVAVIGRATVKLHASPNNSSWEVEDGDVLITNLDQPEKVSGKNKGTLKRFDDGGMLLTRCGVQAAAAASAERMLLGFGQSAAPPLPSASIGILTAQQIKHARERVLDCAFAEAFALSCDVLASEPGAPDAGPGCAGGYAHAREHITRSIAPQPVLPGTPASLVAPSASAAVPSASAPAPAASAPLP